MIFDAHHHLWEFNPEDYSWMDDTMSLLKRDYLPPELEHELPRADVRGTVVVQARQTIEETRRLLRWADEFPFIKGVVGWVDLCSEKLQKQLDELGNSPGMVGVRHVIHDEPDDDFMLRPEFLKGIGQLIEYDLCYDLLLFPKHLKRASELAGRFPNQKFVLDHIGKPFIKDGIMSPWREDLHRLASLPNVWCKVSGMVTEADTENWKYEDFIPYLEVVLELFGAERIMLGSDWPVCRLAGEYAEIMNIPIRFLEKLSPAEKHKIYHKNAAEFYNLTNQ
jgi:L-fuconolactonase